MPLRLCSAIWGNRKGSYSFRVENRAIDKDGAEVVLHSSFLLGALRSLRMASGGSRPGSGCPRGYHPMAFFLEERMLRKEKSVREYCLGEVSIRCIL